MKRTAKRKSKAVLCPDFSAGANHSVLKCAPSYPFLQNRVKIPAAMKRFRRISALLFGLVAPLLLLSVASNSKHAKRESRYFAYVGTYTAKTSSKGIYAYRFDPETGKLDSIGVAAETTDPSVLAVHPSGKFLYAVN